MKQRHVIAFLLLAFAFGFLFSVLPAEAKKEVDIALEAELANEVVAPMVIAVPADVKKFGPKPPDPSNGEFVWTPGPPAAGGPDDHKGYARFIVQIPEEGTYAIYGRVIAWDGNSDSFWVTVKPADDDPNPQASQDTRFRWGVQQGPDWHWDRINQWLDGGTFEREWDLPKGEAEITIWTREAATMLDALWITSDLSNAAVPRLPTDEDRARQVGGLAVSPKSKAAVTWGWLKR